MRLENDVGLRMNEFGICWKFDWVSRFRGLGFVIASISALEELGFIWNVFRLLLNFPAAFIG